MIRPDYDIFDVDPDFSDDDEGSIENPVFDDESEDDLNEGLDDFEFIDDSLTDIDFSELRGDFKSSLKKLNSKLKARKPKVKRVPKPKFKRKKFKPLSKNFDVKKRASIIGNKPGTKTTKRIIIPRDREVIIQGVDKFMLSDNCGAEAYKNIGYYKCKKLKELILIFNNNSALDFNLELFNPSNPLDYLYSTTGNLNNKIQVAGGTEVSYSDVLFNFLANPPMIVNARMVVSGASVAAQQTQTLQFKNKAVVGEQKINPIDISQYADIMQVQSTVINFDIMGQLNRPYIPDGMDVINYTVLAGNTVTFCFYYQQKKLKKLLWKEAKDHKGLL
jgi:hypothetical protein